MEWSVRCVVWRRDKVPVSMAGWRRCAERGSSRGHPRFAPAPCACVRQAWTLAGDEQPSRDTVVTAEVVALFLSIYPNPVLIYSRTGPDGDA